MKTNWVLSFFLLASIGITFSQQKKVYDIGILADYRTSEVQPLLQQLQHEIESVVGEDAVISFSESNILINNYDLETAMANYQTLMENETDIVLAFGPVNAHIINRLKTHDKPTIMFGAVNQDIHILDLTKPTSGQENFYYLVESESYSTDLKKFKELTDFSNLGVLVEAPLMGILPLKETFDRLTNELDVDYKLIPFSTYDDIPAQLEGIDAVYIADGFYLTSDQNAALAQVLIEKKLPSFTVNGPDDVKGGYLATNQAKDNIDQFFRRIALSIESYINGTSLGDLPVYIEYTPRLTINFNTAKAIGIPIKYSLIAETDFVGDFNKTASQKKYGLLEAIDQAIGANLSLLANQKDVELSGQDIKSAQSNYLPSLTANANGTYVDPDLAAITNGQNPEFSTAGNLTLTQTLFSEGANANISIQKSLQKAQQENFNAAQLDLVFDVANAYFNTLILKANAQIQSRNLELTKRNLEIAEQNYDAGQSGKSDMLRFQSQMAQNTQSMVEAINSLQQGFLSLNQVLNNPMSLDIDVEDAILGEGVFESYNYDELFGLLDNPSLREPFVDFLVEEAYNNAPELKFLDYNLDATERNLKLNSLGRLLPTLALQGQYNSTFNRSGAGSTPPPGFGLVDNSYNATLNISLPIFNQNLTNVNRQTAIIQKEQLQINKDNTKLGISAGVRNGVFNLVNQISNIQLSEVSENAAKEALELTQNSYSNGAVNIVQLLDAQNNYLNAQLARVNASYNYLINAIQLERIMGYYFLLNTDAENDAFRQRFFDFLNTRN